MTTRPRSAAGGERPKMNKEIKSSAKAILHIEDAASLALNPQPAYIGAVRDGLRAVAPRTPDAALCREAADFVQTILDAKHACPSARFGGYGGDLGARFDSEFAARCPKSNDELAARLSALAEQMRRESGIGAQKINRVWGQEISLS